MSATDKTKHPIVLVHGLAGFGEILEQDYFFGVETALKLMGNEVFTPSLGASSSTEELGDTLIAELQMLKETKGFERFNLIGHSQGGLVSRYVLHERHDLVASVTTVGTPHFGSPIADIVRDNPLGPVVTTLAKPLAKIINKLGDGPLRNSDPVKAMHSLTTAGAKEFNEKYPAGVRKGPAKKNRVVYTAPWWLPWARKKVIDYSINDGDHRYNGVPLFSWGSSFKPYLPYHVTPWDPADAFLSITHALITEPNDGLVPVSSMHFGKVLFDDAVGSHIDQINGPFGALAIGVDKHLAFYIEHAKRLSSLSL